MKTYDFRTGRLERSVRLVFTTITLLAVLATFTRSAASGSVTHPRSAPGIMKLCGWQVRLSTTGASEPDAFWSSINVSPEDGLIGPLRTASQFGADGLSVSDPGIGLAYGYHARSSPASQVESILHRGVGGRTGARDCRLLLPPASSLAYDTPSTSTTPVRFVATETGADTAGGGKNAQHGDGGRRAESLQPQIEELEAKLAELKRTQGPKSEKKKISDKIGNLKEEGRRAASGNQHSQRGK